MLLFLAFGCEKDEPLKSTLPTSLQEKDHLVKTVYKEDIQRNIVLFNLLQERGFQTDGPIESADGNIVFSAGQAQFIQYGDSHSYTFAVINTPKNGGLENVVFFSQSGTYRIFLAKYDLTEKEIEMLPAGEITGVDILNPEETVWIGPEDIEFIELNESFSTN